MIAVRSRMAAVGGRCTGEITGLTSQFSVLRKAWRGLRPKAVVHSSNRTVTNVFFKTLSRRMTKMFHG